MVLEEAVRGRKSYVPKEVVAFYQDQEEKKRLKPFKGYDVLLESDDDGGGGGRVNTAERLNNRKKLFERIRRAEERERKAAEAAAEHEEAEARAEAAAKNNVESIVFTVALTPRQSESGGGGGPTEFVMEPMVVQELQTVWDALPKSAHETEAQRRKRRRREKHNNKEGGGGKHTEMNFRPGNSMQVQDKSGFGESSGQMFPNINNSDGSSSSSSRPRRKGKSFIASLMPKIRVATFAAPSVASGSEGSDNDSDGGAQQMSEFGEKVPISEVIGKNEFVEIHLRVWKALRGGLDHEREEDVLATAMDLWKHMVLAYKQTKLTREPVVYSLLQWTNKWVGVYSRTSLSLSFSLFVCVCVCVCVLLMTRYSCVHMSVFACISLSAGPRDEAAGTIRAGDISAQFVPKAARDQDCHHDGRRHRTGGGL
jgi:hypothetical protein